jgi:hypothetical protein
VNEAVQLALRLLHVGELVHSDLRPHSGDDGLLAYAMGPRRRARMADSMAA